MIYTYVGIKMAYILIQCITDYQLRCQVIPYGNNLGSYSFCFDSVTPEGFIGGVGFGQQRSL